MTGIQGIPNPNTIWNHDKGVRGGLEDSSSLGMREMSTITCATFNRQEPKLFRMGSKEESGWCHSQTHPDQSRRSADVYECPEEERS